ncbi:MAG TPA: hypothetical protein VF006_10515 [Longimicrobium sp.]
MATRLQRERIQPMWRAGLRRGRVRDTMTAYLAERPGFAQELSRILEESRAVNGPPLPLPPHVRTPFDFDRR